MALTKATQNVLEGIVATGSTGVSAGSFIVGQQYKITSLGTTTQSQWNTIAGTTGQTYVVGSLFTAATTGASSGNGAAAVARTLADRFADVVNVLDFGAVGDGVTDDTAAIQAALNAAPVLGGKIIFPVGTYKVTSTLILPSKSSSRLKPIYICGDSSSIAPENCGSVIIFTGTNIPLFQGRGVTGTDVTRGILGFRDIQLYGGYTTGTSSTNTSTAINLYDPTGLQMKNVLIDGFKYGLKIEGYFYYSRIDYCRFRSCDYGVYITSGYVNGTSFTNCSFSTFDTNAMYFNGAIGEAAFISQCWFENAASDQIFISSTARKIVVRDCYFEYAGTGYAINWVRESNLPSKSFFLLFDGNFVSCGSTATAVIYANNASPNPQTASITISNVNCSIISNTLTEFLKQTGASAMSVVFLNKITYQETAGNYVLPNSLQPSVSLAETIEGATIQNSEIGSITPNTGTFTSQYLRNTTSIYSYDTQELVNYKTDVTNATPFSIFQFTKLGTGGVDSTNYVSCGGILEISYCARNFSAGTARVATEIIPVNIGSVGSGNITLATGTSTITTAIAGTSCTIALSLTSVSSTAATLQCTLTIASGTLLNNDLMFRLKVTNVADSNSRIMQITNI